MFNKEGILIFYSLTLEHEKQLKEIIDAIFVASEMGEQKLKCVHSFVSLTLSLNVKSISYHLHFESNRNDKKIKRVSFRAVNWGSMEKEVKTSNTLYYKNGKISKPISEFMSKCSG